MKTLLRLAVIFSCAIVCNLAAQTSPWIWASGAGGAGNPNPFQEGLATAADASDHVYISGYFCSATMSFGNIVIANSNSAASFASNYNIFLAKYDVNGNPVWARAFGDTGNAICHALCTDPAGNLLMAGIFYSSTLTLDNYLLVNPTPGNSEIFVAKLDSSGHVLWAKSPAGSFYANCSTIKTDASGNVYAGGSFAQYASASFGSITLNSLGGTDAFIVKYSPNGSEIWAENFGGSNTEAAGAIDVEGGNIWVTANTDSPVFTAGSVSATGGNVYVMKQDTAGNTSWIKRAGATFTSPSGISVDADGNAYLAGSFGDQVCVFGQDTLVCADGSGFYDDIFLVKYDPSGNVTWAKRFGDQATDYSWRVEVAGKNKIFLTGHFEDTLLIPPFSFTFPYSIDNAFVAEMDSAANPVCVTPMRFGGDDVMDISISPNGVIFIGGDFLGDTAVLGNDTMLSPILETAFLARYDCESAGIETNVLPQAFRVFPNPASENLTLEFPERGEKTILLFDAQGKLVIQKTSAEKTETLDLSALPGGLYAVSVFYNDKVYTEKIIREE